jgi:hypothetical protein
VRALALLDELSDARDPGRTQQLAELVECIAVVLRRRRDQEGALPGTPAARRATVVLRGLGAPVAARRHSFIW